MLDPSLIQFLDLDELVDDLLGETLGQDRDISPLEWFAFWPLAAVSAARWQTTDVPARLDDLVDRVWARLVSGQRPGCELDDLHHLLLAQGGVRQANIPTLVVSFAEHVVLPRLHDWRANMGLISTLCALREGFIQDEAAAIRGTMERYLVQIAPAPQPTAAGGTH